MIWTDFTKYPHINTNTSKFWPCGDIYLSPWGNKLINHTEWSFWKSKTAESLVWGVGLGVGLV